MTRDAETWQTVSGIRICTVKFYLRGGCFFARRSKVTTMIEINRWLQVTPV